MKNNHVVGVILLTNTYTYLLTRMYTHIDKKEIPKKGSITGSVKL
jgi:hypothetical protein